MLDPQRQLLLVDDTLWVLSSRIGVSVYDFNFESFFPCRHPWTLPDTIQAVARVGAFEDYESDYAQLRSNGIQLIHSPREHFLCTRLPHWYPLLSDLTPRSRWYDSVPTPEEIETEFGWPVFVKGERQTSGHRKSLSIIGDRDAFQRAMHAYRQDPVLQWQGIVCRQYVPLRPVEESKHDTIPASFEFRTFWWKGELVGCGRYWWEERPYELTAAERTAALAIASEAACRIRVPFLVIDIAQSIEGNWIVIECNDGQESGYAGAGAIGIWQNILAIEKRTAGAT